MRSRSLVSSAVVVVVAGAFAGCRGSCASPSASSGASDAAPATVSLLATPAPAALDAFASPARDAAREAPRVFSPEDRRAYSTAMKAARAAQVAHHFDDAVAAFTRALDILPDDPRALSERGFAEYARRTSLPDDPRSLDAARTDLEEARGNCPARDTKLAAQIEYNLGLVYAALAGRGDDRELAIALGHFRQSNTLFPSRAAAAKMGGCPVSWGLPDVHSYRSLDEAKQALADAGPGEELRHDEGDPAILLRDQASESVATDVLLPIDHGGYAHVLIGSLESWHCGYLGEATFVREKDIWTIEYQRHYGVMSLGVCSCDDSELCTTEWSANRDDKPCTCAEPMCPMSCGQGDDPQGIHQVTLLDARDGRALWRWQTDHAFLEAVTIETDVAAHHFRATGLGCEVDVDIDPHPK